MSDPSQHKYTGEYGRVCGQVIGYQFGSPDGFDHDQTLIHQTYKDGVGITHRSVIPPSYTHMDIYAAGVTENTSCNCPCSSVPGMEPPSFVGTNFHCESANSRKNMHVFKLAPLVCFHLKCIGCHKCILQYRQS